MPYKSKAQQCKFHAMESRGEISPETVAHWDAESKGKRLPRKAVKRRLAAQIKK